MDDHLERRRDLPRLASGPGRSCSSAYSGSAASAAARATGGGRSVRRLRRGSGPLAARAARVKSGGIVIASWTSPRASAGPSRPSSGPCRRCRNSRCSAASEDRARRSPWSCDQTAAGRCLRVRIDRIAEQQQLNDRHAEDHRIGHAVAGSWGTPSSTARMRESDRPIMPRPKSSCRPGSSGG